VNLSRERLIQVAEQTGFRSEVLEKAIRLLALLDGLRSHPFLKGRLALKGGTALNLFRFDVPRLSGDIDLNYVGAADRETMLAERPRLEEAVRAVCSREGLAVRRLPEEHAGGKWTLRYESAQGGGAHLEVDLNFMFRVPLWPIEPMDSKSIGPYRATGIPVLDIHEIAGGKLAALMARHAGRDLFDTHLLLTQGRLDAGMLRLAFVVHGAMNRKDWRTVALDDVTYEPGEIEVQLRPVLRQGAIVGHAEAWGRRLVEECRQALGVVLPFRAAEQEFLDRLLDHGEIVPDLLTSDQALARRIAQHPMLEWKAENVRQHKGKSVRQAGRCHPATGRESEGAAVHSEPRERLNDAGSSDRIPPGDRVVRRAERA
jgi:predicted nucleotidyltransferase component of viral defense system